MVLGVCKLNLKLCVITVTIVLLGILIQIYYTENSKGTGIKKLQKNVFSNEELQNYNGKDIDKLYVAVIGTVFDVSAGNRHYGVGQSYHYFVGKDGTRALITGDFRDESNNKDHVLDLTCDNILSLLQWRHTFRNKYIYIGVLLGRYYDEYGKETEYMGKLKEKVNECRKTKEEEKKQANLYPPCNMSWSEAEGTRVWCSKSSGGVVRNWEGVPRQLYTPGEDRPRCVCVRDDKLNNSLIKEYDNCPMQSSQCIVHDK